MRWRTGRRSTNVEDRRGQRPRARMRGPGLKLGGGGAIIALVAVMLLGGDPSIIFNMLTEGPGVSPQQQQPFNPANDELAQFVSVVLADTEDTWGALFENGGSRYQPPKLILFSDYVQSACGMSSAASGPFYCPGDYQVYIDLGFFRELSRMGAPGDFAQAYVIAHEVGHHIQNLVGTANEVRRMQGQSGRTQANALSVLMELQADCYAGVWANHAHRARNILEQGDIEEGLQAAASIGDDRLQRQAGRAVHPESFTHGSSRQRVRWFRTGLESGSAEACNTFAQAGLQ
ncbi:MAG: KPN_02809 family neutral zinc metallopeptidase [Gammaproteobacteria bacterium]